MGAWYLTFSLFFGEPAQTLGPFTEAECQRCGRAAHASSVKLARQLKRRPSPGWLCMEGEPAELVVVSRSPCQE